MDEWRAAGKRDHPHHRSSWSESVFTAAAHTHTLTYTFNPKEAKKQSEKRAFFCFLRPVWYFQRKLAAHFGVESRFESVFPPGRNGHSDGDREGEQRKERNGHFQSRMEFGVRQSQTHTLHFIPPFILHPSTHPFAHHPFPSLVLGEPGLPPPPRRRTGWAYNPTKYRPEYLHLVGLLAQTARGRERERESAARRKAEEKRRKRRRLGKTHSLHSLLAETQLTHIRRHKHTRSIEEQLLLKQSKGARGTRSRKFSHIFAKRRRTNDLRCDLRREIKRKGGKRIKHCDEKNEMKVNYYRLQKRWPPFIIHYKWLIHPPTSSPSHRFQQTNTHSIHPSEFTTKKTTRTIVHRPAVRYKSMYNESSSRQKPPRFYS